MIGVHENNLENIILQWRASYEWMHPLLCSPHMIFACLYQWPGLKCCYVTAELKALQSKPSALPKEVITFVPGMADANERWLEVP